MPTKCAWNLLDYTSKLTTLYLGSYCIKYTLIGQQIQHEA